MKKLLPFLLSISFPLLASAQVVQKGLAVEYNEKAAKTALAGVEFRVQRAGSTASDAKGAFALDFPTSKAGDRVAVRRIEKPGYEIFNKEAVEQWNINPSRAFTVVMCRSDKFKALKDRYYSNSEERYAGQYRSAKAELERLKKEGKLKEQEYFARLREVEAEYEKKLDNLDNYVDRFARIDLSELNAEEQAIIDLVQSGQIDEAIARYEKMNITEKLVDGLKKRQEVKEAISALTETEASLTASTDSLYAMAERQISTLLLAGDSHNNLKIAEIYTTIASADTTNVDCLNKTGEFLTRYMGDYNKALNYYHTVLNVAKERFGEYNEIVGGYYNNIGIVYYNLGEYQHALDYLMKALAISKGALDEENHATNCVNIGNVYSNLGDYLHALEYHEKSLSLMKKSLGEEHPNVAACYINIGNVYFRRDDYPQALNCYQQALSIYIKSLGDEHPDVESCYGNIGMVYYKMGDYTKALELCLKSLTIRKKMLGEEHPDVASSYHNIGNVYDGMGEYLKALEYEEKSLAIRKKVLGEEHPAVAGCYINIGFFYEREGEYTKALECHEKSLAIKKKVFGEQHPDVADCYFNIGNIFCYMGDYPQALEVYRQALLIMKNILSEDNMDVASTLGNIGIVYYKMGDYATALEYLEQGLAVCEKLNGQDDPVSAKFKVLIDSVRLAQSEEGGTE